MSGVLSAFIFSLYSPFVSDYKLINLFYWELRYVDCRAFFVFFHYKLHIYLLRIRAQLDYFCFILCSVSADTLTSIYMKVTEDEESMITYH